MDLRPAALILPGFDGTGLLIDDFARALEPHFRPVVMRYPVDEPLNYDELLALIEAEQPDGDYVVIGESFSGPLAILHAFRKPKGLKAVILGASFARLDLPAKALLKGLAGIISPRLVPLTLLSPLLLGKWSTPDRRRQLKSALQMVAPDVLACRTKAALEIDLTRGISHVALPLLYLRATKDRLIPRTAADTVLLCASGVKVEDVQAPHFLFQTAADRCAGIIAAFYERAAKADFSR